MRAMHSQLICKQIREIEKQCKAMQTEGCTQTCMSCMHNECTATVDAFFMFNYLACCGFDQVLGLLFACTTDRAFQRCYKTCENIENVCTFAHMNVRTWEIPITWWLPTRLFSSATNSQRYSDLVSLKEARRSKKARRRPEGKTKASRGQDEAKTSEADKRALIPGNV